MECHPDARPSSAVANISRRALLGGALGAVAVLPPGLARAAIAECGGLRGANVNLIVTFAPGGGFDVYARLLEPYLERHTGAEVVVNNVTGAGGLIGSKAIRDAAPDGRTIGIIGAGALMTARLAEGPGVPDPAEDFHVLGRLARQGYVWVTSAQSGIENVESLWATGRDPVVAGIQDVASGTFFSIAIGTHLLGIDAEFVAGHRGTSESALAAVRGEIDLTSGTFESLLELIEAGDLRPILQVGERPLDDHPALAGVPLLGGADGLAGRRAAALGRPVDETVRLANAIGEVTGAGRFIVAPKGLPDDVARCLETGLMAAAHDPEFVAAAAQARRSLEVLDAPASLALLQAAKAPAAQLSAILAENIKRVRS
jgi:tripartite-type tricarboxylate transporter receptor subunit TctC